MFTFYFFFCLAPNEISLPLLATIFFSLVFIFHSQDVHLAAFSPFKYLSLCEWVSERAESVFYDVIRKVNWNRTKLYQIEIAAFNKHFNKALEYGRSVETHWARLYKMVNTNPVSQICDHYDPKYWANTFSVFNFFSRVCWLVICCFLPFSSNFCIAFNEHCSCMKRKHAY